VSHLADAAPQSSYVNVGLLGCAALSCMLLVSTIILVIVLVRRNRRTPGAP
jgi:hypothetical protein